jgi:NAD(P)-dependent dehydrogenase (short-subunit alcohol dehydrogenase family)
MAPVDRPDVRRHWIDETPMQRYALPEALGLTLVYLASEASHVMTGSVLVIDGG